MIADRRRSARSVSRVSAKHSTASHHAPVTSLLSLSPVTAELSVLARISTLSLDHGTSATRFNSLKKATGFCPNCQTSAFRQSPQSTGRRSVEV
jgi:hypothetical protein